MGLGFKPEQERGIGRGDLIFGQAVDPLDVEDAPGDGQLVRRLPAIRPYADFLRLRPVAIEADHEQALGRGSAHVLAVEEHLRPRCGAADGEAALLEAAEELQPRRGGVGPPRKGRSGAGEDQDAAVQAFALPWVSSQRWVASLGPA